MNKQYFVLHSTSLDHYKAQAFVIRCFDDRFSPAAAYALRAQGVKHFDLESVAGGAKIFASPEKESDRGFMARELAASVRLHGTDRAILFTHHDCGAYGGFARFHNSEEEEFSFHQEEHRKAALAIHARFSDLGVETYFIDRKGVVKTS